MSAEEIEITDQILSMPETTLGIGQTIEDTADIAMEILEEIPQHLKDNINPERLRYLIGNAAGVNLTTLMRRTCQKRNNKPEISPERLCALINSQSINQEKLARYIRIEGYCWNPMLQMLSGELKKKPWKIGTEREFTIEEIIQECQLR